MSIASDFPSGPIGTRLWSRRSEGARDEGCTVATVTDEWKRDAISIATSQARRDSGLPSNATKTRSNIARDPSYATASRNLSIGHFRVKLRQPS